MEGAPDAAGFTNEGVEDGFGGVGGGEEFASILINQIYPYILKETDGLRHIKTA